MIAGRQRQHRLQFSLGALNAATHCAQQLDRVGVPRDEILDTIAVAIEMGGGPATVYGANALEAFDQFAG